MIKIPYDPEGLTTDTFAFKAPNVGHRNKICPELVFTALAIALLVIHKTVEVQSLE